MANLTSLDDIKSPLFWRAVLAEGIGTGALVFIATGSCTGWGEGKEPSMVQISLCFGLMVATMVWCIGHISGGHINPAVTIGMLITRKVSVARAVFFVIVQCMGATIGSAILYAVTPEQLRGSLGATVPSELIGPEQAFAVEFCTTFILVFTVFASCDGRRSDLNGSAPLTIGLSVTVCLLFAIRYTGASLNPARSLGPAIVAGIWKEHWVYWCGPVLGAIAAALLYDNVFASNASPKKARDYLLASRYDPGEYGVVKEQPAEVFEDTESVKSVV